MPKLLKKEELERLVEKHHLEFPEGATYAAKCAIAARAEEEALEEPADEFGKMEVPSRSYKGPVVYVEGEKAEVEEFDLEELLKRKTVFYSPEIPPTKTQLVKYDEELDDELIVEELDLGTDDLPAPNEGRQYDMASGTYRVKGKTGRKVHALSTIPQQNAQITYDHAKDLVPRVTFRGRSGYLWTHHRLANVRGILEASGYYEDYKDRFNDTQNVWYAGGSLLVCDINLTHWVIRDIERRKAEAIRLAGR